MEIAAGLRFTVDLHGADDRRPATTTGMFRFGSCSVDVATRTVVRDAVDQHL